MTCTEIMEHLMKNGANVNAANPDGQTVLMFAAGKKKSLTLTYVLTSLHMIRQPILIPKLFIRYRTKILKRLPQGILF